MKKLEINNGALTDNNGKIHNVNAIKQIILTNLRLSAAQYDVEFEQPARKGLSATIKITKKKLSTPTGASTTGVYNFFNPEADDHFQLKCAPGQTVLTTKEAIQRKYELPDPQDVTLLFSGKALRDGFVLDRLRIGNQNVVVHIKDRRTLLIYSGRTFDL